MNEITLHGAYKTKNFGDLLLLQLQLETAKTAGVRLVNMPSFTPEILQWIAVPEGVSLRSGYGGPTIFGAGGYFGAPNRDMLKWTYAWITKHLIPIATTLTRRELIYIVGPGAGPFGYLPMRFLLRQLFRRAEYILVRDKESREFVQQLLGSSVGGSNIVHGADLALVMRPSEVAKPKSKRKAVGFHLSPPLGREECLEQLLETLSERLQPYKDNVDFVCLVDQYETNGARRQESVADRLASLLGVSMKKARFNGVDQFCKEIEQCDLVVTTKLHVGIVARAYHIPVIAIPTHLKTQRLYRQLDEADTCFEWSDLGASFVEHLELRLQALGERIPVVDEVRAMAELTNSKFTEAVKGT